MLEDLLYVTLTVNACCKEQVRSHWNNSSHNTTNQYILNSTNKTMHIYTLDFTLEKNNIVILHLTEGRIIYTAGT